MKHLMKSVAIWILFAAILASCTGTMPQVPTAAPMPTATLESIPAFPDSPGPVSQSVLTELEIFIGKAMKISGVPGASVAIVQDGRVIYVKGFGVRQAGQADPVAADTLMLIGSSSKSMTTMMMATLVDDDVITWDTPVISVYPPFALSDPAVTAKVTMHHLACQCTGVPRYDIPILFHPSGQQPNGMIASLAGIPLQPGFDTVYNYNNQMVAAAGYISALATGASPADLDAGYAAVMQERVFDPLGMISTTVLLDDVRLNGNYAMPHALNLDAEYEPYAIEDEISFLTNLIPAGGIWSSASDMGRYLITELNQGLTPERQRVVSAESLTFTWQPQVDTGDGHSYGLGWMKYEFNGLPLVEHNGNNTGFTTNLAFLPTAGIGIVVLSNGGSANGFTGSIRERFFQLIFNLALDSTQLYNGTGAMQRLVKDVNAVVLPETDLAKIEPYLGFYHNDDFGDLTLYMNGDKLMVGIDGTAIEVRQVDVPGKLAVGFFHPAILAQQIGLILGQNESGQFIVFFGSVSFERVNAP